MYKPTARLFFLVWSVTLSAMDSDPVALGNEAARLWLRPCLDAETKSVWFWFDSNQWDSKVIESKRAEFINKHPDACLKFRVRLNFILGSTINWEYECTPLHLAVAAGDITTIHTLCKNNPARLEKKANFNVTTSGYTKNEQQLPYEVAIKNYKDEACKALSEYASDEQFFFICRDALCSGFDDPAQWLLEQKKAKNAATNTPADQTPLLHCAVQFAPLSIIKKIVALNPNNINDKVHGYTPLHYAYKYNWNLNTVPTLIRAGADPEILDDKHGLPPRGYDKIWHALGNFSRLSKNRSQSSRSHSCTPKDWQELQKVIDPEQRQNTFFSVLPSDIRHIIWAIVQAEEASSRLARSGIEASIKEIYGLDRLPFKLLYNIVDLLGNIKSCDPNSFLPRDEYVKQLLTVIAAQQKLDDVKITLHRNDCRAEYDLVSLAVRAGDKKAVDFLLEQNCKVNTKPVFYHWIGSSSFALSPLDAALVRGHNEIVERLSNHITAQEMLSDQPPTS